MAEPTRAAATPRPSVILIVDDNDGDAVLIEDALTQDNPALELRRASDGIEALEQLRAADRDPHRALPDLVLLDLNMPRLDGRQLLRVLKEDTRLRRIPVIVLTTSTAPDDVRASYHLRANCYLAKPPSLDGYGEFARQINDFWLRYALLPSP